MLAAVTSPADPDLPLLLSRPGLAVVVPAHLSRPGWCLDEKGGACLVTSKGLLRAEDLSGVLTRLTRVDPEDLPHVDVRDREYVAAEMTAFLAAVLSSLACPMFNRPTAGSLAGPAWNQQHWWRAAASDGFPMCPGVPECRPGAAVTVLDGEPFASGDVPVEAIRTACRLAVLAGVRILDVDLCRRHGHALRVSVVPRLTKRLLEAIELRTAAECVTS